MKPGSIIRLPKRISKYFSISRNRAIFNEIYRTNTWGGVPGVPFSGTGSHDERVTEEYEHALRNLFRRLAAPVSIADLGCGDMSVGKRFLGDVDSYIACDVSDEVVNWVRHNVNHPKLTVKRLDITRDLLPKATVGCIRQVLQHLSNRDIARFVRAIEQQKPYYFLAVTEHVPSHLNFVPNSDKRSGADIRVIHGSGVDLDAEPFSLNWTEKHVISEVAKPTSGIDAVIRTTVYKLK